jgi:hypothetical protein
LERKDVKEQERDEKERKDAQKNEEQVVEEKKDMSLRCFEIRRKGGTVRNRKVVRSCCSVGLRRTAIPGFRSPPDA